MHVHVHVLRDCITYLLLVEPRREIAGCDVVRFGNAVQVDETRVGKSVDAASEQTDRHHFTAEDDRPKI